MDEFASWVENALEIANGLREFHDTPPLEWSEECFNAAKEHANRCQLEKNLVKGGTHVETGEHGQTLLHSEEAIDSWVQLEDVIDTWYSASDNYCFLMPGPQADADFMTQLLWANSKAFGIAISEDGHYVVANFAPAGNVEGKYLDNVLLPEIVVAEDVEDLGMTFGSLPPSKLIVRQVQDGGWAEEAGIKEGDRFSMVNDKNVPDIDESEFSAMLKARPVSFRLHVGVDAPVPKETQMILPAAVSLHDGKQRKRHGSIGRGKLELVAGEDVKKVGMVMTLPPKPVEVRKVTPGGWADSKGIEPGDTFMEINHIPAVQISHDMFMDLLQNTRPLVFRLPNEQEVASALKIQTIARGHAARREADAMKRLADDNAAHTTSDWRIARSHRAKIERENDKATRVDSALQTPREDIIARLFLDLDDSKDKFLDKMELYGFVNCLGFPGARESDQWSEEYHHLCNDFAWDKKLGASYQQFVDLIDDDDHNPYHCGYDMLCHILSEVEQSKAAVKLQSFHRGRSARRRIGGKVPTADNLSRSDKEVQGRISANRLSNSRSEKLAEDVAKKEAAVKLQSLQRGKQGRKMAAVRAEEKRNREEAATKIQALQRGKQGRRKAATATSSKGSAKKTARSRTAGGKAALRPKKVAAVRKRPQSFSDQQSQEHAALRIQSVQRGKEARTDLNVRQQVFSDFDADDDGFLNEIEMLGFARTIGFPGDDRMWRQEYVSLCRDHKWSPTQGIDLRSFIWLSKNPDDQYYFDASKLPVGGWKAAAGNADFVEWEAELKKTDVQDAAKLRERELKDRLADRDKEMEICMKAEVKGLDWAKLEADEDLTGRLIESICKQLARRTGVDESHLGVVLALKEQ